MKEQQLDIAGVWGCKSNQKFMIKHGNGKHRLPRQDVNADLHFSLFIH